MKEEPPKIRTNSLAALLLKIVAAGMSGNRQRLELLTLNAIRSLKSEFPDLATQLGSVLNEHSAAGAALRSATVEPPPADADAGYALLRLEPASEAEEPILDPSVQIIAERFLKERSEAGELLSEGILPPRTLLLKGLPGTGKTMLASWIARQLKLPLAVLDLATSISSFLGKTGTNLRRSLDYARARPCVLLMDEFDAIGKRRDDTTEHGELKRIVNVLLKELEVWPVHSVLIAATNHPELLDPAIHRRFDIVLEMPMPSHEQRRLILERACGRFATDLPGSFLSAVARLCPSASGSDLDTLARSVVRRHIIEKTPLTRSFADALVLKAGGLPASDLNQIANALYETGQLSVREIAELTGKSSSAIQYHRTKNKKGNPHA